MKGYSEDGKLEMEIPYLHGSVEGLVKRYDENGKVYDLEKISETHSVASSTKI